MKIIIISSVLFFVSQAATYAQNIEKPKRSELTLTPIAIKKEGEIKELETSKIRSNNKKNTPQTSRLNTVATPIKEDNN